MYDDGTLRSGSDAKAVYLNKQLDLVRDNVEFTREMSPEDEIAMEVLKWPQKQGDVPTTLGYYVELARKFMIEAKPKAAQYLLEEFLNNNLGGINIEQLTLEAGIFITEDGFNQTS